MTAANLQPDAKPDPVPEFYRPSEDDRLTRAKEWLRMARGSQPDLLPFEAGE